MWLETGENCLYPTLAEIVIGSANLPASPILVSFSLAFGIAMPNSEDGIKSVLASIRGLLANSTASSVDRFVVFNLRPGSVKSDVSILPGVPSSVQLASSIARQMANSSSLLRQQNRHAVGGLQS